MFFPRNPDYFLGSHLPEKTDRIKGFPRLSGPNAFSPAAFGRGFPGLTPRHTAGRAPLLYTLSKLGMSVGALCRFDGGLWGEESAQVCQPLF